MADARATLAREEHRLAGQCAGQHRAVRDRLIRELRAENPARWTYPVLAEAVGCSPELVAAVVKGQTRDARSGVSHR